MTLDWQFSLFIKNTKENEYHTNSKTLTE